MSPEVRQLLAIVDSAYDRRSWHGTNLRGSIRGLTARQAAWRPAPARHNIWELVVHAAYWKYTAPRRMTAARRSSFPLKGSNWFVRGGDDRAWREDVALLRSHTPIAPRGGGGADARRPPPQAGRTHRQHLCPALRDRGSRSVPCRTDPVAEASPAVAVLTVSSPPADPY